MKISIDFQHFHMYVVKIRIRGQQLFSKFLFLWNWIILSRVFIAMQQLTNSYCPRLANHMRFYCRYLNKNLLMKLPATVHITPMHSCGKKYRHMSIFKLVVFVLAILHIYGMFQKMESFENMYCFSFIKTLYLL